MKRILMAMVLCLVCTLGLVSCEKNEPQYKHAIEAFDIQLNLPTNDTLRWNNYGPIKTVSPDALSECPDKLLLRNFRVSKKYDDRIEGTCRVWDIGLDFIFYYKKTGADVIGHTANGDPVYKDKYNENVGTLTVYKTTGYGNNEHYVFWLCPEYEGINAEIGFDLNATPPVFYQSSNCYWRFFYHLFGNEPELGTRLKMSEVEFIKQ